MSDLLGRFAAGWLACAKDSRHGHELDVRTTADHRAADRAVARDTGSGRRDYELLAHLDLVRIGEIVGLGDDRKLIRVSVVAFADLGQVVAGLNCISLVALAELNVVFQVFVLGINRFDRVPDALLAGFLNRHGFQKKLIAIEIDTLQLGAFALNCVNNRLILSLKQIEQIGHVSSLVTGGDSQPSG